jgi:hypothetical protein
VTPGCIEVVRLAVIDPDAVEPLMLVISSISM